MKKGKVIGKIFGITLVFVMIGEPLAGFGSERHQALTGTEIIIDVPCNK